MMFVLRMAARETRSSWRRLLFFFICIAVGVAAIVTLRSVIQSVRQVFGTEAKALIAGDLLIATNRDWTPDIRRTIDRRLAAAGATDRTELTETPTMVRPADRSRQVAKMAELRAVQRGFPLYGAVELQGGQTYSYALIEGHGALVRPELLTSIGVAVGDQIIIGQSTFTIRGVIAREPGRGMGEFSLGPRVIVDYDDVPSTGLLSFGSRARRVVLVKLPDESRIEPLVTTLRDDFKDDFINTRSFRSTEDQIGRDFNRAENYLSLVGLIIVILGGIAVSSVTRVFILQKIRSIAVLKCVGARSLQIVTVYILQVVTLGLAGSLLGIVLARGIVAAIPMALGGSTSLLATVHYGVTWSAAAQGVGIGVLVSLLFSVVPLLHVRFIKPSLLLRDETVRRRMDWLGLTVLVAVSAALVALTAWQAASLKAGIVVCAGFAGLAVILQLAGQGLIRLVAPLAKSKSFPLRHAVLHLSRPGNQTRVILLAVGLGAFFIVGVRSLQGSLLSEFSVQVAADGPDMFLLDVQRAQAEGVRAFLADPAQDIGEFQLIPVLRGRVVGVSGRETTLDGADEVRQKGVSIGREFTLTYRDHLESNEHVVEGAFWNGPSSEPEVSIEKMIAERAKIHVGDTMRFDILGQTISPKVTSIRDVEWRESRNGGFVFVFRSGVLDRAPQTFVAPFRGPKDVAARARFQHDLVERFPNVSVIDFHEVLETIRDVMSKVTLAITVVGGLVLLSGVLILVGAVAMTKFQRVYEAAVFKTLGANTRTIAKMLLFEYGVLGSLAGVIGSLGAVALTWGVSTYALEIPWRIFPAEHAAGVLLTALLVAVIGVLSSLEVLRNKPLATLRAE
ncbi:MAG: ABC transporter permease [Acidobacteria bacterium]|nr:ABC transporter permease [Acidobacteriota bacterium]